MEWSPVETGIGKSGGMPRFQRDRSRDAVSCHSQGRELMASEALPGRLSFEAS